ncbi:MAG: hypothetical protein GQ559_06035, partial [Desulfobulbaceae bacterium]|nr:hypothetical protein [Desulfobulbaceae bacterium]
MKAVTCIGLFLLTLLFRPLTAMAFTVDLSDDRLSIDVQAIPLQQVLHDLARQGLTVKIDPQVNPPVTASFQDTELEHGLRILLKKVNHTFTWETPPGGTGEPKLTEIRVFRPGHRNALEELIAREKLAIRRHPERGNFYVKDELLIRLKPGAEKDKLSHLVRQIGGKIIASQPALGIYRVQLPEDTDTFVLAEQLADDDKATSVINGAEPNYAYPIALPIHAPHETADLPDLLDSSKITGKAPIAILDSGLQPGLGLEDYVIASEDAMNPHKPISDRLGHGTQMALVAAGI